MRKIPSSFGTSSGENLSSISVSKTSKETKSPFPLEGRWLVGITPQLESEERQYLGLRGNKRSGRTEHRGGHSNAKLSDSAGQAIRQTKHPRTQKLEQCGFKFSTEEYCT